MNDYNFDYLKYFSWTQAPLTHKHDSSDQQKRSFRNKIFRYFVFYKTSLKRRVYVSSY